MKTEQEINEINAKRKEAMQKLREARQVFAETGCSLGADIILTALRELKPMEEY
jgi:hypothetical protein